MIHRKYLTALILLITLLSSSYAQDHQLILKETSGIERTNLPLRFGQPFAPGEITDYPQVLINGSLVSTQANVLQRWDDGSVRHAVMSLIISSLSANSINTISFTNQVGGQTEAPLMTSNMLEERFNFEALFSLTSDGNTQTVSGRQMLTDNAYVYWCSGSIATEVILADHSESRVYDLGWDTYRSFRPIVHATFWDAIDQVDIRFIGENSNTETLQDLTYDIELGVGNTSPQIIYTRQDMLHHGASRWSIATDTGGLPSGIELDPNIGYMARTKLLPNYDSNLNPSEGAIQSAYDVWTSSDHDLFEAGNWMKYMPGTGGRPDIGLYPTWVVQYLYTGDERLREKAFGNADLAAAWPMHFREGDAGKWFDETGTIPALGHPISIKARPTIFLLRFVQNYDDSGGSAEDIISAVGPFTNGNEDVYSGWYPDQAHQPDPFTALYLISGDFFLLEEAQFWASYTAGRSNHGDNSIWSRSIDGSEGGLIGEIRGQAWGFRSRVHTASVTPDEQPEQSYFENLIDDAIALWEGLHDIIDGEFSDHSMYSWGQSLRPEYGDVPYVDPPIQMSFPGPLHQWSVGHRIMAQQGAMNPDSVLVGNSPWENNFMTLALGRAEELGYRTNPCKAWLGQRLIDQFTTPGYNPYFTTDYREPGVRFDTTWYEDWAAAANGFRDDVEYETQWNNYLADAQHGYTNIARAAMSTIAEQPGGVAAWGFISEHGMEHPALVDNPKWALLPRGDEIHAPYPVFLLYPENGNWGALPIVDLQWNSTTDPDPEDTPHYDVWIDTLDDMSTAWQVADSISETSVNLETLTEGQMIYWRVRATDTNSEGTWSDTWCFLPIEPDAPSAVELEFPFDEMQIEEVYFPIRFRWCSSSDPDPMDTLQYELNIYLNDNENPVIHFLSTDTTELIENLEIGNYSWLITTHDRYNQESTSDTSFFSVIQYSGVDEGIGLPKEFVLHPPAPNPFNSMTRITFDVPQETEIKLILYDVLGREVRRLINQKIAPGRYSISLDGNELSSGVYFLAFKHNVSVQNRKIVLLK